MAISFVGSATSASYSLTGSPVSFSLSRGTLPAVRRRYDVTINDAELFFTRRLFADTGAIDLVGSPVQTNYTFPLLTESGGFVAELNGDVKRHLILRATTRSFQLTRGSAILPKGYSVFAVAQTYGVSAASADLFHAAFIGAVSSDYVFEASPENFFQRHLLFSLVTGAFLETLPDIGVTNNPDGIHPAGMATRPPAQAQGGSEPSYPSFIRPQYVRFNSVVKARDLGLLNNIYVNFAGKVGSQVGTNTVFFKLETTGPADLRINKNPINRFTDGYISVGILDDQRKPVPMTANGFGFRSDIANTPANEYEEYLPGGVYYFTVSSSQWQALDFDITIQVIRFRELSGRAEVSMTPYGRLPFAKMRGVADLTGPFIAIIPPDHIIKRFTGTSQLSSTGRGTITIMQGTVTLAMVPRGRLLTNHKLNGVATMNCAPVATLSSAPPYGGGYGY